MIVWHVCSLKKLHKYCVSGQINPPVRAWDCIEESQRFSLSTGRRIILRLKFPKSAKRLYGHKNRAYVLESPLPMTGRI